MVHIGISDYLVAKSPEVLVAYGLGSCLAIILHDANAGIGALAHTLLPNAQERRTEQRLSKFVDTAIALMLREMVQEGARRERITARIAGGANMFESAFVTLLDGVGARNARSAIQTLEQEHIPLVGEAAGGNQGRSVEFDLGSGQVRVRTARDRQTTLFI